MGFLSSAFDKIGGSLVSGVLGIGSTALGNNSARQEAQLNREWQEELSNTAVQRRVADMRKAGINPILSVSGASAGASTPTGGQANIKHFDPGSILALSNARLVNAQAKAQENDNDLYEFKKRAFELDNRLKDVRYELIKAQSDNERVGIIQKVLQNQGIFISNKQAWEAYDLLRMKNDIYRNGYFDEEMLLQYPGLVNEMFSNSTKSLGGALGSFGSGISHSSAKFLKSFRESYYYWINEIEKNREKYQREHWR